MSKRLPRRNSAAPDEFPRFAAKRLSSVEVGGLSNQHEFHGSLLRRILGFETKARGELTLLFYRTMEPLVFETYYTIYDAREGTDRTEWRLYYEGGAIGEYARPGDLLLIARPGPHSTQLHAIIAPNGSEIERRLRHAFTIRDSALLERFAGIKPGESASDIAVQLAIPFLREEAASEIDLAAHPLYAHAIASKRLPSSTAMAKAADALVTAAFGSSLDSDSYIDEALKAETQLFEAIEHGLGQEQLEDLVKTGADYTQIIGFALSKLQARKTRRGASLQNHFENLLRRQNVPYSAQCTTERKERPDFILPSCAAYQDPQFPADRLRMVGCKAKLRDRWRQYLAEAERIPVKHHLCLDPDLSDDVVRTMHAHSLRTCMPRRIIDENYAERDVRPLLMTVEELISELRSAVVG